MREGRRWTPAFAGMMARSGGEGVCAFPSESHTKVSPKSSSECLRLIECPRSHSGVQRCQLSNLTDQILHCKAGSAAAAPLPIFTVTLNLVQGDAHLCSQFCYPASGLTDCKQIPVRTRPSKQKGPEVSLQPLFCSESKSLKRRRRPPDQS